ncbi:MAG: flagellar biosynthesis protein FlhF [Proteobacteria bacterium]|nr:flagellar biosynthesis protein FlhF [Pseudomonadota bacterium]
MQVKIFESTDMASGLKLVKETLGPDALILSTRTIRNGKMGILGKPILEITAAVDTPWPQEKQTYPSSKNTFSQWSDDTLEPQSQAGQAITYDSHFRILHEPEEKVRQLPKSVAPRTSGHQKTGSVREAQPEMRDELDELKEMVKKLGQEMSRISISGNEQQHDLPLEQAQTSAPQGLTGSCHGTDTAQISSILMAQGVSEATAKEISARVQNLVSPEVTMDDNKAWNSLLQDTIRDILHVAPLPFSEEKGQRRIALVGPTGVGKTTTLAKIAAHYLSNFSNSIALITIDTYRIAAVEQLKVYGTIMNLPVEVVISPEQLEQALLRHSDKELILIDTAGRSPRDTLCIKELATFLRTDLAIDKHLVLSATTRRTELFEAINRFGRLGINNTIITKTDECSKLGVMLDIQMHDREDKIPFSWITNGQRVPEDLLPASRELVAELIMTPVQGITHEQ